MLPATTLTELSMFVAASGEVSRVTIADEKAGSDPRLQNTMSFVRTHDPGLDVIEITCVRDGIALETITSPAASGPRLVIVKTVVSSPLTITGWGESVRVTAKSERPGPGT